MKKGLILLISGLLIMFMFSACSSAEKKGESLDPDKVLKAADEMEKNKGDVPDQSVKYESEDYAGKDIVEASKTRKPVKKATEVVEKTEAEDYYAAESEEDDGEDDAVVAASKDIDKQKKKTSAWLWWLVIILAIIAAIIVYLALKRDKDDKEPSGYIRPSGFSDDNVPSPPQSAEQSAEPVEAPVEADAPSTVVTEPEPIVPSPEPKQDDLPSYTPSEPKAPEQSAAPAAPQAVITEPEPFVKPEEQTPVDTTPSTSAPDGATADKPAQDSGVTPEEKKEILEEPKFGGPNQDTEPPMHKKPDDQ